MWANFNSNQRRIFAEKLLELANIAVGGLVFGQFLGERKFSVELGIIGLIILVVLYITSYFILRRG